MSLLVHTPKPNIDESLFGYILRLSDQNGYDTPKTIFQIARMDRRKFSTNIPLKPLTEILGKPSNYLDQISPQIQKNGTSQIQILSHQFDKRLQVKTMHVRKAWFCPACIKEKGYIEAFWGLRMAVACPVHHSLPLMACPACKQPIAWMRRGLLTCKCGEHLAQLNAPNVDPIILDLIQIIYAKLQHQDITVRKNPFGFPINEINQLSLASFLGMLERLSAYNNTYPLNGDGIHPALYPAKFAAESLRDWPNGYHQLLFRLQGNKPPNQLLSFQQQYNCFYLFMFKLNQWYSDQCDFLIKEFVRFGAKHWDSSKFSPNLIKHLDVQPKERFISFSAYSKRFKIRPTILEQNIQNGQIIINSFIEGKKTIRLIDLALSKDPIIPKEPASKFEAATHLGLPVEVLEYFRKIGIYNQKSERFRLNQPTWDWDALDAFLSEYLYSIDLNDKHDSSGALGNTCSFGRIMRRRHHSLTTRNELAAAVFDGRIKVIGRIEGNFEGLLLNTSQVNDFMEMQFFEHEPKGYSLFKATELTGLENMVIGSAVELGLLTKYYRQGWPRITESSLELFNSNYITLKFLAIKLGFNARRLGILCRKHKIPFICLDFRTPKPGTQLIISKAFEPQLTELTKAYQERRNAVSP